MTDRVTSTNTIPCLQLHIKNSCMCLSEFMTLSRVHDITEATKLCEKSLFTSSIARLVSRSRMKTVAFSNAVDGVLKSSCGR